MISAYAPQLSALELEQFQKTHLWWLVLYRYLWVLESRQGLIGTICLQDTSMHIYVSLVTVLPGLQRGGFGRMLMEFAEAEARRHGFGRLSLTTPEKFVNAVAFYQHLGFVEVGRGEMDGHNVIDFLKRLDATPLRPASASARHP
jgi:GNAT superfamily N-acetyltransferase